MRTLCNYDVARQVYEIAFGEGFKYDDRIVGSKILTVYLNAISGKVYQSAKENKRDFYVFDHTLFSDWLDCMTNAGIFDDANPEETTDKEHAIDMLAEIIESQVGGEFELTTYSELRHARKVARREARDPYSIYLRNFRWNLNNFNWGASARALNCVRYFFDPRIDWNTVEKDISAYYGVDVYVGLYAAYNRGMKSKNKFYQLAKKLILASPHYREYAEEYERADDDVVKFPLCD